MAVECFEVHHIYWLGQHQGPGDICNSLTSLPCILPLLYLSLWCRMKAKWPARSYPMWPLPTFPASLPLCSSGCRSCSSAALLVICSCDPSGLSPGTIFLTVIPHVTPPYPLTPNPDCSIASPHILSSSYHLLVSNMRIFGSLVCGLSL